MPEKVWHLKSCDLLSRLTAEQLERIESRSRSRSFPAKTPVYLPSERADSLFVLASGLVKICHLTADGKESILAFIEPGEMFGELAIFDSELRNEYVEAVEPSTVVMIPADVIQQLMTQCHDLALGITKMVGLRRHRIECRLRHLLFLSNRDRLIHLLLDLAEQFGVPDRQGIRLRVRLSHQELGNLIGSTRETVTGLLGQLRAEGMVGGGRCTVVLTAPDRLARSLNRQVPCVSRPKMRLLPVHVVG